MEEEPTTTGLGGESKPPTNQPNFIITGSVGGPAVAPENETELERQKHGLDTSRTHISGKITDDIEQILNQVRLPERRGKSDGPHTPPRAPLSSTEKNATAKSATPNPDDDKLPIVTPLRTLKDDLQRILRRRKLFMPQPVSLPVEKKQEQKPQKEVPPVLPPPPKLPSQTPPAPPPQPKERIKEVTRPVQKKTIRVQKGERRSHQTFAILFSAGLLTLLGSAALLGVYVIQSQQATPPSAQGQTYASILFAEQTETIALAGRAPMDLKQTLAAKRQNTAGSVGSITRVVPTIESSSTNPPQNQAATLNQFLLALDIHPPADLLRALGDDFFFGMSNTGESSPLIVIQVNSYDRAFAGMLAWEKTINTNLSPIFIAVPIVTTGTDGLPAERTFQDVVIRNYDVRALKDDSGKTVLYYAFPTPLILVIAENPYTFTEILNRLQAARKL